MMRGRLAAYVASAALLAIGAIAVRAWPDTSLRSAFRQSTAITARDGELLRLTLASDAQYRLWVALDDMPARLPAAVLLYEDRWFHWHPGVNPVALLRAAVHDAGGGRRLGASTISMQLARRLYSLDTRTARGKLRQMAAALWLESRHSKREILEAYLNTAPYGGNVQGVGTASLVYFGVPVARLSVSQLMTLAVIPQNPQVRGLDVVASNGDAQTDARRRLWVRWLHEHPRDAAFSADLAAPAVPRRPALLPFLAPHFTDTLVRRGDGELRTTLDLAAQRTVERVLRTDIEEQSAIGIRNAGALLLELTPEGVAAVRAYVGSADYHDSVIFGQVNAVVAKRSPGSTLKPFVYALALDQGLLHPRSILKDTPSSFGPFSPENFDGRFLGPVSAEDALIRSRNVPAVAVASRLAHPNLYDFLRDAGVARLNSERYYGLALPLGGGEMTMEELGRLYAVLLNGGRATDIRSVVGTPVSGAAPSEGGAPPARLLSEEASYVTLDMLERNPRPDTGLPASPAVAWKTGTSWGFHDAWSVGVFGRHILVVWIGNFDNTANPAFIGVQAAAPLLFRIVDALRQQGLARPVSRPVPRHLARIEVCAASGDLPNADCPQTVTTWYIPGTSPIRVSELHRRIHLDPEGRWVCRAGPGVHDETYEFWPSDMLRLFREAGMPRRRPPPAPNCGTGTLASQDGAERDAPQIVSPLRGVVYTLRAGHPQPLSLRATSGARARSVYWFVDNAFLGRAPPGEGLAWLPPQAGHHVLRAIDDTGASDNRPIDIEVVP